MKTRNTKIAMASLLAVSAIAPVAVAAEETVTPVTTTAANDTVNLTYNNSTIAKYLPSTGKLTKRGNQTYISLTLDEASKAAIVDITVDGKSIVTKVENVGTFYAIPVTDDTKEITAVVKSNGGGQERSTEVKITVEQVKAETTGEATPEVTTEATPEVKPTTPTPAPTTPAAEKVAELKYLEYYPIADGTYDVTFDAFNPKTGAGDYKAITNQLDKAAKLVVEEGNYYLEISEIKRDGDISWIKEYQVKVGDEYVKAETVAGELNKYPHVVRLPITSLNGKTTAKLNVVVEAYNMNVWYDFEFSIDKGQNLPQLYPTYVYKDGTNEASMMQGLYLTNTTNVELKESGLYEVDLTFPQGQFITGLELDGKKMEVTKQYEQKSLTSAGKEVTNTIKIYTFETADISKIYTAGFDLNVPGVYNTTHHAQIQLGGDVNPFKDVMNSYAYGNIISLYSKGIFKADTKFNPKNKLTREQFSLMLNRAFDLEVPATTKFADLEKRSQEVQEAVKALNNYGIINGATETKFNPTGNMKRYEAALMVDRLLAKYNLNIEGTATNFSDTEKLSAEAKTAIANLNKLNIIQGKGDNKFDPNGTLTRQDMAIILDKVLKLIEKQ